MSGAAKSNVLIFLAAVFAIGTVWLAVAAAGQGSPALAVAAIATAALTVVTFRAYRSVLRDLDAEERSQT